MADQAPRDGTGKARQRSLAVEWEVVDIDEKKRDLATDHFVVLVVVLVAITVSVIRSAVTVIAAQW